MTDQLRSDLFDARLERVLTAFGDTAVRAIDPLAIAGQSILLERRRAARRPWAWLAVAATVALLGLLAVAALGGGGRTLLSELFGPSPRPTPEASDVSGDAVPSVLQGRWMGSPRTIGALSASAGTYLAINGQRLCVSGRDYSQACTVLLSDAAATASGELQLTARSGGLRCEPGAVGTYRWHTSPGGGALTIEAAADACAARSAGVAGVWYRSACSYAGNDCLGLLEAGTYPSQFLHPKGPSGALASDFGAIEYTVPDGWANSGDWPVLLSLTPAADYAHEGPQGAAAGTYHELDVFAHPLLGGRDKMCHLIVDPGLPNPTIEAFAASLRGRADLVVLDRGSVVVDGHPGLAMDITRAADARSDCAVPGDPETDYLVMRDDPGGGFTPRLYDGEIHRLILVDLDDGELLAILIDSSDPARFDDLVAASMPIVSSLVIR